MRGIRLFTILILGFVFNWLNVSAYGQDLVYQEDFPAGPVNDTSDLNTTGDGYIAIPFKDRFYYINHHTRSGLNSFGCVERISGSGACGTFMQPIPLPDGDNDGNPVSPHYSTTADANEEYHIIARRYLYYPVTRFPSNQAVSSLTNLDWGVGCFDMETNTECGFFPLSNNPDSRSLLVAVEGPFAIGEKLYFLDLEGLVHCVSANPVDGTLTTCTGVASLDLHLHPTIKLPRFKTHWPSSNVGGQIGGEVVGDKIYFTLIVPGDGSTIDVPTGSPYSYTNQTKVAICIDTVGGTTMIPCSGWASVGFIQDFSGFAARSSNVSNYIYYDTSMNPISICNRGTTQQNCINLSDGSDNSSLTDISDVPRVCRRLLMYSNRSHYEQYEEQIFT